MAKATWPQQLARTISKLAPRSKVAQFREDYAKTIRSIKVEGKSDFCELLLEAGPFIESWVVEEDKCPCCALREWSKFYDDASAELPLNVLTAIAKKLPQTKPGAANWQSFFFRCTQKAILATLFDRRMVSKGLLLTWVADKLKEAYSMPLLDLAIDHDAVEDYRALWNGARKENADTQHLQEPRHGAGWLERSVLGDLTENQSRNEVSARGGSAEAADG